MLALEIMMNRVLQLFLLVCLVGCVGKSIREQDEEVIREDLSIPADAKLESLVSDPSSNNSWFGREGLRIVAIFRVDTKDIPNVSSYLSSHGWALLPMPGIVSKFYAPPTELPNFEQGLRFCTVWYYGEMHGVGTRRNSKTVPCEQATLNVRPSRDNFNNYRVAVFNSHSGELFVVAKNYY